MLFQIHLKRHEIFSATWYLIGYQQFLLYQIILINKHLTKICCFAVKFLITNNITDLSQLGKGGGKRKSYKVLRLGNDFSHSENYPQKMPPIASCPLCKRKTCSLKSTARRKEDKDSEILRKI